MRLIAALLLAAIAWGGTVEFTHNHGVRAPAAAETKGGLQTFAEDQSEARVFDADNSRQSSSRSKSGSECLICQLHQNLATTLLTQWASVATTEVQRSNSQSAASVHLFEFTAAQQGRAPPVLL